MNAILIRTTDDGKQTLGSLQLYEAGKELFRCVTLELAWKDNKANLSCIPKGFYVVKQYISQKFGRCFKILNVLGRSDILIHAGNFNRDTHGCILVGAKIVDLDKDTTPDVSNSAATLKRLLEITDNTFELQIL